MSAFEDAFVKARATLNRTNGPTSDHGLAIVATSLLAVAESISKLADAVERTRH